MRIAPRIKLSAEQRTVLERMAGKRTLPARMVERAQIVLRAAGGLENQQIARLMGSTGEGGTVAEPFSGRRHGRPREGCPAVG